MPETLDTLPDHRQRQRDWDVELFAAPPPDIGPLRSADSTLRKGNRPKPMVVRVLMGAAFAVVVVLLFSWMAMHFDPSEQQGMRILGYALAAVAFYSQVHATRFKAVCTYVGELGAARSTIRGSLEAAPATEVLLFANAAELFAKQTRHFVNGIYSGTTYDYRWVDSTGKLLYRDKGQYKEKRKGVKSGDLWHFACAAERSWTERCFLLSQKQIAAEGSIPFRVDTNRSLRVGPSFVEFHFDDQPVRVARDDIASVSLKKRRFSFQHKDAKMFSRVGRYSFAYEKIANAQLFLFTLDRIFGWRIE